MRRCGRCRLTKPAADFQKSSPWRCRSCVSEYDKSRYAARRERHREKMRERYVAKRPEYLKAASERYRKNPQANAEYNKKFKEANPDKWKRYQRTWRQKNPDKKTAEKHRRRARKAGAVGNGITAQQWRVIRDGQCGVCAYCSKREKLTLDHVVPLARGGADDATNAAAACLSCNASKQNTQLLVWLAKVA